MDSGAARVAVGPRASGPAPECSDQLDRCRPFLARHEHTRHLATVADDETSGSVSDEAGPDVERWIEGPVADAGLRPERRAFADHKEPAGGQDEGAADRRDGVGESLAGRKCRPQHAARRASQQVKGSFGWLHLD